jgi:glycolate oxidase FAD binding subunit
MTDSQPEAAAHKPFFEDADIDLSLEPDAAPSLPPLVGSGGGGDPALQRLIDRVRAARTDHQRLCIRGGGTKDFYGEALIGETLDTRELSGISSYEPSELVVTVRAGTPLSELEAVLAAKGQCLAFEPPHFGPWATVGGMVAAGLSGPTRGAVGCVRDYVLGATLLTGRGEVLSFGGQVIKNVAGYDVSRVLAGSLGILGVICEVSLKVIPVAPSTLTLRFPATQAEAITLANQWAGQPLPLVATAWWHDMLVIRLSGARAAVSAAHAKLGGEFVEPDAARIFWGGLREHSDEFFMNARRALDVGANLWRLSVPQNAAPMGLSGELLIEWGGGQRWLCTTTAGAQIREAAKLVDGHATLFRTKDRSAVGIGSAFTPLTPALDRIHRELKAAFDPDHVFNFGRLYAGY